MNHQGNKAEGRQIGRWLDRQVARSLPFSGPPVYSITSRSAPLPTCLLLVVLTATAALAQVPSHSPSPTPETFSSSAAFQPAGRPVVRVNGTVLTDRDLLREMYAIFPYARIHNGFPKAMEADIRNGAMQMMIFEELVYQEAKHRHMTISPVHLARALSEFRGQFGSPQQYQQFLQAECQGSPSLLTAKVERSLLIDQLLDLEVADKAGASLADARAYFDQHTERFRVPESFSFQSISFLPPGNATAAQAKETRQRAEDALRQAKAMKSYDEFGRLAEKTSEDDFRVMMGDHKAADRSKLPAAVVTALLAMQPGQVSDIIEFDSNAYTIMRLNAHIPAGTQRFETVQENLLEQLKKEKTERLRSALAVKLSKNAKIEKL